MHDQELTWADVLKYVLCSAYLVPQNTARPVVCIKKVQVHGIEFAGPF
jgi:hypothetical protein